MYYRNAVVAFLVYSVDDYVKINIFFFCVDKNKGIVSKSFILDKRYRESITWMLMCAYRRQKRFGKQVG